MREGCEREGFEYVTVGHVTRDLLEGAPAGQPGGGAFYSALQAARLGLRTLILTRGNPEELEGLLDPYRDELTVRIEPAEHTTTMLTSGWGRSRGQRLLAWAGPMRPPQVQTSILHLAAVARETPASSIGGVDFVGLTPQGLVRRWGEDGEIGLVELDPGDMPERLQAVVVNELEFPCCGALLELEQARRPVIAVTSGSRPATVHLPDGSLQRVPVAAIAHPRDDLGAGDVYAAVLFVSLREGLAPVEAAARAGSAAAIRIEGMGAQAIGRREAIVARASDASGA